MEPALLMAGELLLYKAEPIGPRDGLGEARIGFARPLLNFADDGIGSHDRRRRLIATLRVRDPEIVLGMLVEIFGREPVVADRGLAPA